MAFNTDKPPTPESKTPTAFSLGAAVSEGAVVFINSSDGLGTEFYNDPAPKIAPFNLLDRQLGAVITRAL